MPYSALPDRRMPWDNDGTIMGFGNLGSGVLSYSSGGQSLTLNGYVAPGTDIPHVSGYTTAFQFFPETREVTAFYGYGYQVVFSSGSDCALGSMQGSTDSTNGLDGTWETASMASGVPAHANDYSWRSDIKPVSFTGGKKAIRAVLAHNQAE